MKKRIGFCTAVVWSIVLAVYVYSANTLSAQTRTSGVNSDGRDFFIGSVFPSYEKVANPTVESFFGMYLLISSYESGAANTKVHISYFDPKTGIETIGQSFLIPSRTGIQIPLDSLHMRLNDTGEVAEYKSCHITADAPVNVQYFSTGACSGGSYLALPTSSLGKKYAVASYDNNPGVMGIQCYYYQPSSIEVSEGFFEIIAPFDSTTVTIIPNSTTMRGHRGVHNGRGANGTELPYTITLNRGQCYFVKSASDDNTDDISGSIVESDKPVAILGGHENAAIGGTSNRLLEGRDFMVEQMIPAEFWDSTGYVSIPLKDSQPADQTSFDGVGENYRMFSYEKINSQINFFDGALPASVSYSVSKFGAPAQERDGVTFPVDLESSTKFSVMMYDQRNIANSPPFPAPSMMTIIPISRWKTSYLWYVPANKEQVLQGYYVNVIAQTADFNGQSGILASMNGGSLAPIKSILNVEGQFKIIPNHPELTGIRFKLSPGSYYANGPHPFMVYNYGFRAFDPNFDLGDFDCDDYFFSYANPVGAALSSGDPGKFSVTVDSQCGKWHICMQDLRTNDPGIRSITILNDAERVQYYPGKKSANIYFDPALDPSNSGEIELPGIASNLCFDVHVKSPIDTAYAAILITDNAGNLKEVELQYAPVKFSASPSNLSFATVEIGADSCEVIRMWNTAAAEQSVQSASIDTAGGFSLSSVSPALPVSLRPGDTVTFSVCLSPTKNGLLADTLKVILDCLTFPFQIAANGGTGVIKASDIDFGKVDTGTTVSQHLTITNIGTVAFTLSKLPVITGSNAFRFTFPAFPVTLGVNGQQSVTAFYSPTALGKDTAIIHWVTDIPAPYTQSLKSYSLLTGEGVAAPSSVKEIQASPSISVRPNPASGNSIILTLNSFSETAEIHIFDVLGREMYKRIISPNGQDSQQIGIPIGNLQNGIYYARVSSGEKTMTEKFEVQR